METVTVKQALDCEAPDTASPVVAENGNFAMKYYQPGKVITRCNRFDYYFTTRANICMDWIQEQHVGCILNKRGGCCGQKRPGIFTYANASDVRRWTNGGGR